MKYERQFDGSAKKVGKSPSGIGQRESRVPWRHDGRLFDGGRGLGGKIGGRTGADVVWGGKVEGIGGFWGQLGNIGGCGAFVGWGWGHIGINGGWGAAVGWGCGQLGITGGKGAFVGCGWGLGVAVGWGCGQTKSGNWLGAFVGCGPTVGCGWGQIKSGNGLLAPGLDGAAVVGAGNEGKVGICALAQATKVTNKNFHMI